MATITCKCGTVKIQFHARASLCRLECCCHDCTLAVRYAHKERGGPPGPEHQVLDSNWFPNDFAILGGEERIGAFMNYKGGKTTRFHCKDCWTCLMADHPAYFGKIVLTQVTNFVGFEGLTGAELPAPRSRHFMKDLSAEQLRAMPVWSGPPECLYQGVTDNLLSVFQDITENHETCKKAPGEMNAQLLFEKVGRAFIPCEGQEDRTTGGG